MDIFWELKWNEVPLHAVMCMNLENQEKKPVAKGHMLHEMSRVDKFIDQK